MRLAIVALVLTACACPSDTIGADAGACADPSDCAPYFTPAVCGVLACDIFGFIGAPPIDGVPHGCYVGVNVQCEADPFVCFDVTDCPPTLADACHDLACDSTGKKTAPGAGVLGCFLINHCPGGN